ncbi:MFS transporter [Verticiella sediminum]|uniref:MFS transporter n=1 Tax=Verticiella sediminum TaxID=1247510 RepID=A0A556AJT2_9BURK|nr:MFS transporter [Verticiella sediminum]
MRAAFILALFGWGVGFYGPPVYLAAVMARTGWSLSLVSAAITLHFLAGTVVIASLPRAYARLGVPRVTMCGAAFTALGVLGWAVAGQPWQLFAAAAVSGAGWVTMGAVAVNTIVSRWYVQGRPLALARAYNGATLGGVLFVPLWAALIQRWGFVCAVLLVGACMLAVVGHLARRVLGRTPASPAPSASAAPTAPVAVPVLAGRRGSDATPGLWRSRAFVTLAFAMAVGLFAQIGLLAHLFALLAPRFGEQFSSLLMGAGTACAIGGRYVAAAAVTRFGQRRAVAAASYAWQALGGLGLILGWLQGSTVLLVAGVLLFGAGIGNATSLPPLIAQTDFPAAQVGVVVARIVALSQAAYAFAPLAFGTALGMAPHGSPLVLFAGAAVLQVVAALALLGVRRAVLP